MTATDPNLHPVFVYELRPRSVPPEIPTSAEPDPHAETPFAASFDARRAAFLDCVRRTPPPAHLCAVFHEVARLAAGGPANTPLFEAALDYVDARLDCADFVLHGILRLLLHFGDDPRLPPALVARADASVLGFKYWPDEPGSDSLCTWTENHQILFASAALLAGQRHPDARFANSGATGRELAATARGRVLRWLDLRFRSGFSEWLSHVYYDEDVLAVLALVDFAADSEIATRAAMVADLLFLDIALQTFRGVFASSHGRSYDRAKIDAREEGTTDLAKLAFGVGAFARIENQSAVALALSRYRVPAAIEAIVGDVRDAATIRQRMGLRLDQLAQWQLDPRDPEDMMVLLSLEAYAHPRTIDGFVALLERFGWWPNAFFAPFASQRKLLESLHRTRLLPILARVFEWDMSRNVRDEVDLVTHRTPDYQLSSATDWNPGRGGDQHHVWQATLAPDAVCFTTHPGPRKARSPGWWTGSATLPRVAQVENLLIAIYRIPRGPALYVQNRNLFTHAWLARDRFDELCERAGWFFARRGDGYLALRSQQPATWVDANELQAPGRENVWICELGRRARDGSFEDFVARIAAAKLAFGRASVRYESPSQRRVEFGWRGPFLREGTEVKLRGFARYDAPWAQAPFPSDTVTVRAGGATLDLDWPAVRRNLGDVTPRGT